MTVFCNAVTYLIFQTHIWPFNSYIKHTSSSAKFKSFPAGEPWSQEKVKPRQLIPNDWPIFSTCYCRICNHIKGHPLFTDRITKLYNKEHPSLLPLSWYCDPLICLQPFHEWYGEWVVFHTGKDPLHHLSDVVVILKSLSHKRLFS